MEVFLGLILGLITLFVPAIFWPQHAPRLSGPEFIQQYPDKKWAYYFHISLPIVWILLYLVVISPLIWRIGENALYLMSFIIGGGLSLAHGIIEIGTSVSMRNFSRGGPAQYVVNESIKRLGWIRIGLVLVMGATPLFL